MTKEISIKDNDEELLKKVMNYYIDENTFFISPSNKELLSKINQILSLYPFSSYIKVCPSPQEHKTVLLYLDCLFLKNQNPEDFFILMKYMTTFGEESLLILKIIAHTNLIKTEKISVLDTDIRVKIKLKNGEGLFGVKSSKKEKLPFNSFVQFTGNILNVSIIKKINTKVIYECPFCGVIGASNLDFGKNNKNNNEPDTAHKCDNNEINRVGEIRIQKIFSEPIYVRYLLVETEFGNINCLVLEEDFDIKFLYNKKELMFEGIVKSKQFNDKQNSNIYKKFVKLLNIYEIEKNSVSFEFKSNMLINQNKILTNLSNFVKQKNKFKTCYKLLGFKKVDYNNLLFFYYLFSLSNNASYNLRIHIVNLSKNELSNLETIKRINESYPKLFKFINNETISHHLGQKNNNNYEVFQNYFGNSNLVINNYDTQYMTNELKNIINNLNSFLSCFDCCQNKNDTNISNIIYNPNIYSSFFTMSNSFNVDLKGYDVISLVNNINTSNNDPYLANKAILNEFNSRGKKRNYNSMNALSEKIFKNNFNINSIKDDIMMMDSISFEEFFEQLIKNKETQNNDFFQNNYAVDEEPELDIENYIDFVNEYVEPVIKSELFEDIYFLSEHIKEQFDDLQAFSLFDINWISINTLQKFAKISARIDLRDDVNKDDLIKAYFMTKEFIQKIYVHVLLNKTNKARKGNGNKAKIEYVMEKLRQFQNMSGDKISVEEIKSFGCFLSHEYDNIIEQLNMQGILLKSGPREYQILLD
jgi:hypothetical protein